MVTLSPVGLAGAPVANSLSVLATFKEKLCQPFCIDSTVQPLASIVYTLGTAELVDSTLFVPVKAVISIVTPGCGCNAKTHLYTETFTVAFQGQTATSDVTITSEGRTMRGDCVRCGKAYGYTVNDSLIISLTA